MSAIGLKNDLDGRIDEMILENVKHITRQIKKLIETHDKLYAELNDTELLNFVNLYIEDKEGAIITHRMELYPSMRK